MRYPQNIKFHPKLLMSNVILWVQFCKWNTAFLSTDDEETWTSEDKHARTEINIYRVEPVLNLEKPLLLFKHIILSALYNFHNTTILEGAKLGRKQSTSLCATVTSSSLPPLWLDLNLKRWWHWECVQGLFGIIIGWTIRAQKVF